MGAPPQPSEGTSPADTWTSGLLSNGRSIPMVEAQLWFLLQPPQDTHPDSSLALCDLQFATRASSSRTNHSATNPCTKCLRVSRKIPH